MIHPKDTKTRRCEGKRDAKGPTLPFVGWSDQGAMTNRYHVASR